MPGGSCRVKQRSLWSSRKIPSLPSVLQTPAWPLYTCFSVGTALILWNFHKKIFKCMARRCITGCICYMPLTVTVNTNAERLRTDCNILGGNKKSAWLVYLVKLLFHSTVLWLQCTIFDEKYGYLLETRNCSKILWNFSGHCTSQPQYTEFLTALILSINGTCLVYVHTENFD